MASGTRIPEAELTGIYGAVVTRMARKMFGEVPEPLGVYWHNRKVLNFSFTLARKTRTWDRCDENLKTFAHMAVASMVGCSFCLDLTYFQAHNQGLDLVKAREVPGWRESDIFAPLERDVMEYAETMTQARPRWWSWPHAPRWRTSWPAATSLLASSRRSSRPRAASSRSP
jgi:alkylhydroperoxidase family enzyme